MRGHSSDGVPVNLRHAYSYRPEHAAWCRMKSRCYLKSNAKYEDYGGRGIRVAPEWINDFEAFHAHVGDRPSARHSLGRIENDGNYEPGNVEWQTLDLQNNNTRRNRLLTHAGKSQTAAQWAREVGLTTQALSNRLTAGWSVERALSETPRDWGPGKRKAANVL